MKFARVILTLLLAFMCGCATTYQGRKIDSEKVKQMAVGITGVEKVTALFGKPDKIERLPSGEENYIYQSGRDISHWWTINSINSQKLEIVVKDGVVQTYTFREEGKEAYLKE